MARGLESSVGITTRVRRSAGTPRLQVHRRQGDRAREGEHEAADHGGAEIDRRQHAEEREQHET